MITVAPWVVVLLAVGVAQAQQPSVALSDLDTVKSLYASAAYEEVLRRLDQVAPAAETAQLDEYRALSLIALGRTDEAEQAFERMVRQAPEFVIPGGTVSPRIATLFSDVRQRVLSEVVRDRYAKARATFDDKDYPAARTEFSSLLAVLAAPDVAGVVDPDGDLKQLVEGFLTLATQEIDLAARAAAPAADAPAAGTSAAGTPAADGAAAPGPAAAPPAQTAEQRVAIYSANDTDVTPPVEISRRMPPWAPPAIMARSAQYQGTLEIVVDEQGTVASAAMIRPTIESYDLTLLEAARKWRFEPASRHGEPVKYRMTYVVSLEPRR